MTATLVSTIVANIALLVTIPWPQVWPLTKGQQERTGPGSLADAALLGCGCSRHMLLAIARGYGGALQTSTRFFAYCRAAHAPSPLFWRASAQQQAVAGDMISRVWGLLVLVTYFMLHAACKLQRVVCALATTPWAMMAVNGVVSPYQRG